MDAATASEALRAGSSVTVELPSGPLRLLAGELDVRAKGRPGFAVANHAGELVALDVHLDDDLRRRGLVREVVRQIEEARRVPGTSFGP